MEIKTLITAMRLPFVSASALTAILSIVWSAVHYGVFNFFYALSSLVGVILVHIGANTLNDYFDWNVSDASNPYAGPFNGGSRSLVGDRVSRGLFLVISLVCLILLAGIGLTLILKGRFYVLYFSICGFLLGYLYSSPPFKLHSRGFGELIIFLAFGPVLSAAVCYVMTGTIKKDGFLIGIPAGLSTTAILWINQFPDYDADRSAGKMNLTVRLGLKFSRYFYAVLIVSIYLSTALLIFYRIFSPWAAIIVLLAPAGIRAAGILFRNYRDPGALLPAQAITIRFQTLTVLLTAIGLIIGHWIY